MNLEEERLSNLDQVLSSIPDSFEFKLIHKTRGNYELENETCVLNFSFDRYESSKVVTLIFDPQNKDDDGMSLFLLRFLLHANTQMKEGENKFHFLGRLLVNHFSEILNGDFSIRRKYDLVEDDFYDKVFDVRSLPSSHPARQKYDNYDLGWLNLMDR